MLLKTHELRKCVSSRGALSAYGRGECGKSEGDSGSIDVQNIRLKMLVDTDEARSLAGTPAAARSSFSELRLLPVATRTTSTINDLFDASVRVILCPSPAGQELLWLIPLKRDAVAFHCRCQRSGNLGIQKGQQNATTIDQQYASPDNRECRSILGTDDATPTTAKVRGSSCNGRMLSQSYTPGLPKGKRQVEQVRNRW